MERLQKYLTQVTKEDGLNQSTDNSNLIQPIIIVPVYNGYEALMQCIDALLEHTPNKYSIYFLNDASTDSRVAPLLNSTAKKHNHIKVTHRPQNLGYLENVNHYLINAQSDVLLLNSDTMVTGGWLDEIMLIAQDHHVGSVCPLSNEATILSVKNHKNAELKHLKDYSSYWFPIPTAVGFCMLIKQVVLEQLGGFDPYYDPGYGEECDYSMRIRQLGLQIACAPAAFVFHQGSASFQNNAAELQNQHQKLLDLRWPQYSNEIANFILHNPVKFIEQHLQAKQQNKPRILHVVHGIDSKGGVELFTQQLLSQLSDDFTHCLLIPERPVQNKKTSLNGNGFDIIELARGPNKPKHVIFNIPADLNHHGQDVFFKNILEKGQYNLVHFHSLVGIGTAVWPLICHRLGIPYFFFFHDHSGLCQIFSLSQTIDNQEIYCGKKQLQRNSKECQQCIQNKTQRTQLTTESYLKARETIWQETLKHADKIYFPSDYLRDFYLQSFAYLKPKSMVISPCLLPSAETQVKALNPQDITIAFLGQFGVLKGAQLFIDLYHHINHEKLSWKIIGGVDPKYNAQLRATQIECVGSYETSQLMQLLKGVDVVVFTSQIPETYGITLTESWVNGIPVVAPNIGAYISRVEHEVNGMLYEHNNLQSLADAIQLFIDKQCSHAPIKAIKYCSQHETELIQLQQHYHQALLPKHNKLQRTTQSLLPPPKLSAYQQMQQWLDSPATLEAEADWLACPSKLQVHICGPGADEYQVTQDSIFAQTQSAELLSTNQLLKSVHSGLVLLIEAGCQVNENLGNWINMFIAQNKALGMADFALVNQNQQMYGPQFEGRFSWTNYLANNQQVGCILLNLNHWPTNQWQRLLGKTTTLNQWVMAAHQLLDNQIVHFPYFSYLMPDVHWAKSFKQRLKTKPQKKTDDCHGVLILVETNLLGHDKDRLIQRFKAQTLATQNCTLVFCDSKSLKNKLDSLRSNDFSHRLLLTDNIHFSHSGALNNLLVDFENSSLDVVTIPTAQDRNHDCLVAKKMGSAPYFYGVGRIKDMRFMAPNTPVEHELVDEDFVFFKGHVWHSDIINIISNFDHYRNLKLSHWLQKEGHCMGIIRNQNIYKQGLPSIDIEQNIADLSAQRLELIDTGQHRMNHSFYSKALSCRQDCELDLDMASFKTPKNLPRVIAYAQDEWASGFYRVKSPLTALAGANHISIHFLSTSNLRIPTPHEIDRLDADVLLLHGFYSDQQLAALNQIRKQLKIPVVISIDDLLTHIPSYNPFASKTPEDIKTRIKLACSLADTLVVTTQNLADHYAPFHPHIRVVPNRLSKHIWPPGYRPKTSGAKLRIGWAGAGQHLADLAWLRPVVEKTKDLYDWVFFGDRPAGVDVEFHEPVELAHYPQKLHQLNLDLAVAPLVSNPFNLAKSQLKLIEFGALGIPVIASNLLCYQQSPATLLENDESLWIKTINDFNMDRQLLNQAGAALQQWVTENHYLEDHLEQWLDVLQIKNRSAD